MTLDIARFGSYTVRPVKEAQVNYDRPMEGCPENEAEVFGVYADDSTKPEGYGLPGWVADFLTKEDALTFAQIMGSGILETIHEQLQDVKESLSRSRDKAKILREERDQLVSLLSHICNDCFALVPTALRKQIEEREGHPIVR